MSSEANLSARAAIFTTEPWHPAMGWNPGPLVVDETFETVVSEMGREGVTWLRLHVAGSETWVNLANVVTIGKAAPNA